MTVLLVDDDPDDVDIFCDAIKTIEDVVKCIHAFDGEEALSILKNVTPDLIFLDLNMPKMNGEKFLIEIKHHSELQNIPIAIYSTTPEFLKTQIGAGLNIQYLKKQPTFSETVNEIRKTIKRAAQA